MTRNSTPPSEKNSESPGGQNSRNRSDLTAYLKKTVQRRDKGFERQILAFLSRKLELEHSYVSLKELNEVAALPCAFGACKVFGTGGIIVALLQNPSKTELWDRYIDLLHSYSRPVALAFNTGGIGNWVMTNDFDYPLTKGLVRRDLAHDFIVVPLPEFVDTLQENPKW